MDIGSGNGYPSSALSNFAPHKFTFRGVECASMEGLLQSFKFSSPEMQCEVCKLVGMAAKSKGASKNWQRTQTLYWQGQEIKRKSKDYQKLLDEAYAELAKNTGFQKALISSKGSVLTHSIGKTKMSETVLTKREFCSRLTDLRECLLAEL